MKYRLFCCDFDGTLLRDDFTVSEQDAAAVYDRGACFRTEPINGKLRRRIAAVFCLRARCVDFCPAKGRRAIDKEIKLCYNWVIRKNNRTERNNDCQNSRI